jgi:hypothetical protein
MDSSSVGVLVVIILVAIVTLTIVFAVRAKRQKELTRVEAMSPAERAHHDAVLEYYLAVKNAEKAHAVEIKAREQRLKIVEKAYKAANDFGTRKIASYRGKDGSVSVTGLTIATPQGNFRLDQKVNATVDTAGNLATSRRTTFTRVAAGAVLFGPVGAIVGGVAQKNKIHDNRELYLMVEGDGFAGLITCNPDDGQKVRQFAMAVKQAATRYPETVLRREIEIKKATKALETERAATGAIDKARAQLEITKLDTSRIDSATRAIESASPDADPLAS